MDDEAAIARGAIDAIVVTHNSMLDLPGLLECVPLREAFRHLVVVDNASRDATVGTARAAGAAVVVRDSNDGFGAAVNEGMRHTASPLVCILNPDIRFYARDVAQRLAPHFATGRVGLVAPALELPDGRDQDSAREFPMPSDLVTRRLRRVDRGAVRVIRPTPVPWVVGACFMVRREAFDAVGGFDERFHLYFEDVDLCKRLWLMHRVVLFDPTVRVAHVYRAASRRSLLGRGMRQHVRSALRFYARYPRHIVSRGGAVDGGGAWTP